MSPTWIDPGRKGGIYGPKPLPIRRSPRTRLFKAAHDNGWRWDFISGGGDQFIHEDGARLYVTFHRFSLLNPGTLRMPGCGGVEVTPDEVWRIVQEGLRCVCVNYLPFPNEDQLCPDPKCKLGHAYEHAQLEGCTVRPIFCRPASSCGYCFHCTNEALVAPYQKEAAHA